MAAAQNFIFGFRVEWQDVWPGALFTSVLFAIGKFAIGLYLGKASIGSAYGAAGSLVIVLVWVYYSSQILFFGAEFTQIYAELHGSNPQRSGRNTSAQAPAAVVFRETAAQAEPAALGNAALSARQGEGAAGVFGTLAGSALATIRIVKGLRR
jgi:membrane protein